MISRLRLGLAVAPLVLLPATLYAQTFNPGVARQIQVTGFSTSLAVQGEEIFVGRTGLSVTMPLLSSQTGGVHVFRRDPRNGAWRERSWFRPNDAEIADAFGQALDVDGNTILVGAPHLNGGKGAAYIFERADADGEWTETVRLVVSDGAVGDSLGRAVALDGDYALVAAPAGNGGAGVVHVFRRTGATWAQAGRITAEDGSRGDGFGRSVGLGGVVAVVGAPGKGEGAPQVSGQMVTGQSVGTAYVYRLDAGTGDWRDEGRLSGGGDRVLGFGSSMSFDGRSLIIGAPATNSSTGAAFVYEHDGSEWRERGALVPSGGARAALFGTAVSVEGDAAWIGAPGMEGFTGAVYTVQRDDSGDWGDERLFSANTLVPGDVFGARVAVAGDVAVVGALGTDFGEGMGFVFERDGDDWRPRSRIVERSQGLAAVTGDEVECSNGAASFFQCADVDLVSFLPIEDMGGARGIMLNDVWGWTDPESGREYALVGRFDGTAFVDISDPVNPFYLGELPRTEGSTPNLWRDIKVYENHAFIVADGAGAHGMQVFDLTQLRNVINPPVTFSETAHYDRMNSAHNIVINEETGFAYTVGNSAGGETCGGALHMINIQDPARPEFAGCFADRSTGRTGTGYTHDSQCVVYHGPDAEHAGKEICFNASETALGIADVTDKDEPVSLSAASYPNVGYSHQGWVTEDQRYFYLNDELDEIGGGVATTRTLVWDVADLDDPILVTEHLAETKSTDHNLYIRGNLMYQANYVSGLRIFDISDPVNPVEVAFFDTVPFGEDQPGFAGAFSNYPYFESGLILVTSMREGLFLLRKSERPLVP